MTGGPVSPIVSIAAEGEAMSHGSLRSPIAVTDGAATSETTASRAGLARTRAGDDSESIERLLAENALLRFALEAMPVGFSMFDADDRLQLWNARLFEIWPFPEALRVRGTDFATMMATLEPREIEHPTSPSRPLGTPGRRRREYVLSDGRRIEVHVDRLPDGATVAVHEDVTEKRADEARIRFLATHDSLTGLPNRTFLREFLERVLHGGNPERTAVLYLDLDRFKAVNDTLGHSAGDLLLVAVAHRIRTCTRVADLVTRIGGDEFVIVQRDAAQPDGAADLGQRIVDVLSRPFDLDGRPACIGGSVGVAVAGPDATDPDALLKNADRALYRTKAQGRGAVSFFEHRARRRAT